jgi:hypothetical protein
MVGQSKVWSKVRSDWTTIDSFNDLKKKQQLKPGPWL